jgi:hypothetical protein
MNVRKLGWVVALSLGAAGAAEAQAWNYPALQHPHIVRREYTFNVASGGDAGTALWAQWREGLQPNLQLNVEGGFADPDGGDTRAFLGGGLAFGIARASQTQPLDALLTAGAYVSFGDKLTALRLPIGVSLGHRFQLQQSPVAITPFIHPRISIDILSGDNAPEDETDIALNFDLGADFELNRNLSLRAAILIPGGDHFDDTGFGFGLGWRPAGPR